MTEIGLAEWIGLIAALLAAGAFGGIIAGLLGVGGGIIIVPALYHLFDLLGVDPAVRMHVAVGTSLATIIPTSILSTRTHHAKGAVDFALLKSWGPWVFVGVALGTIISGYVSGDTLTLIFASFVLLIAANLAFAGEGFRLADQLPGPGPRAGLGGVIGTLSAMMGIGGGTLSVPALTAFGFPVHRAVGTAAGIGLIIALPGAIGFALSGLDAPGRPPLSLGHVNLAGFAIISVATFFTAPVGAQWAHRLDGVLLKRLFALFLVLTSARMFYALYG